MSLIVLSRIGFYLTLLVISLMSVLPQEQVVMSTGWDKANHALAFFVLLGLLDHAYPGTKWWSRKVLPLLVYGVFIELVQSQIPGRYASWLDVFADGVGIALYGFIRPQLIGKLPFIDASHYR